MYTEKELRNIFQSKFNLDVWYEVLHDFFNATTLRKNPELLDKSTSKEKGYFLGSLNTDDSYSIGLFYYRIDQQSVASRRVGLRNLVKSFINQNIGLFDAALVVYESDTDWRLSFVSDIKDETTAPKRYTFVFGSNDSLYNTAVGRFFSLQKKGINYKNIKETFSVEALTKQFYNELFEWYQWAVAKDSGISFPNNTAIEDDDQENIDIKIIRLITRIMFVWFIKQKNLVPDKLFRIEFIKTILKDFNAYSSVSGNYYNAILQNLFFATLNRAIEDENGKRRFAHNVKKDIKTLYRYAEMFTISEEEVIEIFSEVPFLNGGLFECLDKTKTIDGVEQAYNYDGFSRNDSKFADGRYRNRAIIPNQFFFDEERGLFPILNRYNFTIEENTPNEQQVALDPELLGKVFENLLGAYNPETKETARNQSGSFYTPREIVNYMVDESLKAYLGRNQIVENLFSEDFIKPEDKEDEYQQIADKLKSIKVLDPACGSGAFPMGLLNRIVDILQKINPEEKDYAHKLTIIENCLYGSDIQSIAAQITKLRFFISLICECEKDPTKDNFGIPTLPNLETKFVSANTLISKANDNHVSLFENPEINPTKKELAKLRHEHFLAKTYSTKVRLRKKDQELREKLVTLLDMESPADAFQLAKWNPYDQNEVADFFDPEWMFGIKDGFDIIIGNPPYIQLQNNKGALGNLYKDCGFKTFAKTGDIYCLFYERGYQLLKPNGHLCYITSNKWMRAGYGQNTRKFLAENTDPQLLIDFAGVKIFESATVDTNILLFEKSKNKNKTICAIANKDDENKRRDLNLFVQENSSECAFNSKESWIILNPIEMSIKRKIEAVGTPLKDWNVKIYRGVLTGCNEAFIISTEKRDEILANCLDDDEKKRTEKIIRPILRGRDIKRYGYEWAELWLIATFPSCNYDINDYPSLKQYLLSFGIERLEQTGRTHFVNGERIKSRKKTNNKWFETQDSISYWEDFNKPKIAWPSVGETYYSLIPGKYILLDTNYFFSTDDKWGDFLLTFMNSSIMRFWISINDTPIGSSGAFRHYKYNVEKMNIPKSAELNQCKSLIKYNDDAIIDVDIESIDNMIFDYYNINNEERLFLQEK